MGSITEHLTTSCKFTQAITIAAGATANTDVEGAALDMQGFSGVCAVVMMGPITTGAATYCSLIQSDNSNMSSPDTLTGTKQTIADDKDNTTFIIDAIRPAKRYVQLHVDRATQAATTAAIYIQYGATNRPVTQPTGISGVERFADPTVGTP